MKREAQVLWERAGGSLAAAKRAAEVSANDAAALAYFAAFHAVSAHFRLVDQEFIKHRGVEAAVHSQLVRPGVWTKELGALYSELHELRLKGDYGVTMNVSAEQAQRALIGAQAILEAIFRLHPDEFPLPDAPPRGQRTS